MQSSRISENSSLVPIALKRRRDCANSSKDDGEATRPAVPRSQVMIGMINSATMFATLIIGLIAGPAVSL
jgi:hypothetical protein